MTGVTFGSGDSDAFGFDAKTGRMTSYGFAVNGQSDSGALTWNGDGSLARLAITDPSIGSNARAARGCCWTSSSLQRYSAGTRFMAEFGRRKHLRTGTGRKFR